MIPLYLPVCSFHIPTSFFSSTACNPLSFPNIYILLFKEFSPIPECIHSVLDLHVFDLFVNTLLFVWSLQLYFFSNIILRVYLYCCVKLWVIHFHFQTFHFVTVPQFVNPFSSIAEWYNMCVFKFSRQCKIAF